MLVKETVWKVLLKRWLSLMVLLLKDFRLLTGLRRKVGQLTIEGCPTFLRRFFDLRMGVEEQKIAGMHSCRVSFRNVSLWVCICLWMM